MEKIMMRGNNTLTVQEGFDKYIRLKELKNLSPETIKHYKDSFRYFSEFFDPTRPCSDITRETVFEYLEFLQSHKNVNTVSINTYLRSLRTLFYFFIQEGWTQEFKIELLKAQKEIKKTYTDEELERLLEKPNVKKCNFSEYRSWVIANYLLAYHLNTSMS